MACAHPTAGSEDSFVQKIVGCLECPVCFCLPRDPKDMGMCSRGHLICKQCIRDLSRMPKNNNVCPTCRAAPIVQDTPIALQKVCEELLQVLPIGCRFTVLGCDKKGLAKFVAAHEKTCLFRQFKCPRYACGQLHTLWEVKIDQTRDCFRKMSAETVRGFDVDIPMTDFFDDRSRLRDDICKVFFLPNLETEFPVFVKIVQCAYGVKLQPYFLADAPTNNDAVKTTIFNLGLSARCKGMGTMTNLSWPNFLDTPRGEVRSLLIARDVLKNWCLVMGNSPVAPEELNARLEGTDRLDPAGFITTACANKRKHVHLMVNFPKKMETLLVATKNQIQKMA